MRLTDKIMNKTKAIPISVKDDLKINKKEIPAKIHKKEEHKKEISSLSLQNFNNFFT